MANSLFPEGSGLTPAQLAAARAAGAEQQKTKELLQTWAYDTQDLASSTSYTEATFFQTPQGQSNKTWTDTNMRSGGFFPGVRALTVRSIVFNIFDPTNGHVLATDLGIIGWGYFALTINDRPFPDYFQIKNACGGSGVKVGGHLTRGCFGDGTINNALSFNDPFLVTIQPNDPFRVEARWDAAITPASNLTELSVILFGRGTRRK